MEKFPILEISKRGCVIPGQYRDIKVVRSNPDGSPVAKDKMSLFNDISGIYLMWNGYRVLFMFRRRGSLT